jgi:hypothetical protein
MQGKISERAFIAAAKDVVKAVCKHTDHPNTAINILNAARAIIAVVPRQSQREVCQEEPLSHSAIS